MRDRARPCLSRRSTAVFLLRWGLCWTLCAACMVRAQDHATGDWRDWEAAKIRLHVARAADLRRHYYAGPSLSAAVAAEQEEVRQCLDNLKLGRRPPQAGTRIEAYISEIDDSPQPFWSYVPHGIATTSSLPLLVVLHGYDPYVSLATAQSFPDHFTNLAQRAGVLLVSPFGRGNTDFQHIGEQDVLRVIDEMRLRHGADTRRVVLSGISMGGLGTWCIGARWADRFNALLVLCGRGDFYVWHGLEPQQLPGWQRELVDTQFATRYLERLLYTPVMATHGRLDDVVSYEQGRFPPAELIRLGARKTSFITFTYAGHDVFAHSFSYQPLLEFLGGALRQINAKPPRRAGFRPGTTGSRLQDAFLDPFIFIGGDDGGDGTAVTNLRERAAEWQRFAFARPRMMLETSLDIAKAARHNLFVFGEPETSPLARAILEAGGVDVNEDEFGIAGRRLPRQGNGIWFTGRNPFNANLTAVVQSGLAWGAGLPDNHRYDRIPDVIVFTDDTDRWGCNVALAAGFISSEGKVRWSDPAFTEAIRRPPDPPPMWMYNDDGLGRWSGVGDGDGEGQDNAGW